MTDQLTTFYGTGDLFVLIAIILIITIIAIIIISRYKYLKRRFIGTRKYEHTK
jgi:hypothetical protein